MARQGKGPERKAAAAAPTRPAPPPAAGAPGSGGMAPKQTVVLRAGPPASKGRVWDVATAVLGVLLIVASVWLVSALPKVDVPPNQFRLTFVDVATNLTAQTHQFTDDDAGRSYSFPFNVTEDDVYDVTMQLSFVDDVAASAPDYFQFELRDPNGESPEGHGYALTSFVSPLKANSSTEYEAQPVSLTYHVTIAAKPQAAIVTAQEGATEADVVAAIEKQNHRITAGTWTLRVTLETAGDCVDPTKTITPANPVPSQDDLTRYAACQQETAHPDDPQATGKDPGNSFTVGVFTYTRFEVHAERFG